MSKTPQSITLDEMPQVFVSGESVDPAISRAVETGALRELAPRLYTKNMDLPADKIVHRHLWKIVAGYYPGCLIADRTALENMPAPDGSVCLISNEKRDIKLPGVTLRARKGVGALPSDRPFVDNLSICSTARALVENMKEPHESNGLMRRTLSREELEEHLDTFVRRLGDDSAKQLRKEVCRVGESLSMQNEAGELDVLFGALLGTRPSVELQSQAARARQKGRPYDPSRMDLFGLLHDALQEHSPTIRPDENRSNEKHVSLAFYEAYFSNYIEGTKFTVKEARNIVFHGHIPDERPRDAHDVLGTWLVVSDKWNMGDTPDTAKDFMDILKVRHTSIMGSRPDMKPGEFKRISNQAGSTVFVHPDMVEGTLEEGFEFYKQLSTPFSRAVFMQFLVAEVHPFVDGNGRVGRVMMNAELTAGDEERIVVPTMHRSEYITSLKAMSQTRWPAPLIRMLDEGQRWTAAINWQKFEQAQTELQSLGAFVEPDEGGLGNVLFPDGKDPVRQAKKQVPSKRPAQGRELGMSMGRGENDG